MSTGDERVLLSAAGTVVGLSIEGRRVAWAERISRRQSYVRALTLPR